ncbi:alpha/beta fold hydrolase [Hydrogenophaga sp.]|nr:hypothetical protein [Hydrogenophaga sp.]MDO9132882.1 hypothetical protein [Hydrogenophaga sp.]MDP2076263.1 hypothetical protein [Hydrogenophaga sp.]MDP3109477.1 hypothetical protein [Hydrogenophaga sp.]MDP3347846.1 hypothetical protein [Hydrogenophaga sp.]MDZ4281059.1 hypothetical protein [Hydrogenophaga sp.]
MPDRKPHNAKSATARHLLSELSRAEHLVFEQLGHMGPITDPEPVNEAVTVFLQRHA